MTPMVSRLSYAADLRKARVELLTRLGVSLKRDTVGGEAVPANAGKKQGGSMARHDEREHLREAIREYAPEIPVLVPIHLAGCQHIADCFMVNRETVRQWKKVGAPIAMIGGRLTAEYNMLMHWHVRQSANGTGEAR